MTQKFESHILYYRIFYETNPNIPYKYPIQMDSSSLHVKLQHKGSPIPLHEWFKRNKYKMNSVSRLVHFVSYINNYVEMNRTTVLNEMNTIRYIKPKARKPYSSETLRFSLMQRYTSRQSYVLLQHDFPLPSLSVLKNLPSGGIEPIKAIQLLRENEL